MSSRRDFIFQSASFCVAAAGFGVLAFLESCSAPAGAAAPAYDAASNKISMPLSAFGRQNKLVIDGPNSEYKIFLVKNSETEVTALQLKCTHRGHAVNMEDAKLRCPLHGSEFDFSGNVTRGPAAAPLKKFPVTIDKGKAVIILA